MITDKQIILGGMTGSVGFPFVCIASHHGIQHEREIGHLENE
jgi:hypothetical protein